MEHRVASPPILCVRGLRGQQSLPYGRSDTPRQAGLSGAGGSQHPGEPR